MLSRFDEPFWYLCRMNHNDRKTFINSFRNFLIDLRRDLLFTQEQLSKITGVRRQSITNMEGGKSTASLRTFCELARATGYTPGELMDMFYRRYEQDCRAQKGKYDTRKEAMEYVKRAKSASDKARSGCEV